MAEEQQSPNNRESPNLAKNLKRSNKPMMERRRRERINSSLEQLKSLVLEALNRDTSQYSKLEKADILEMTVKHLRGMQRQQLHLAAATDNTVVSKYRAGFTECAQEVTRYLGQVDGLPSETRGRLMQHLGGCVQRMHQEVPAATASPLMHPGVHVPTPTHASQHTQPLHLQMPTATPMSTLPGATTISPQQALINASPMSGVPVIQALNLSQLSQLPVLGGLVIPTNSFALQQQLQQQHMLNQNQNSCQFRDMNNNDVNPMPSLMGKQQMTNEISRCESRDSCSSSSSLCSPEATSRSSQRSPITTTKSRPVSMATTKSLPVIPEPIKLEPVPQPQMGSMWRPWSGSLLVH